jgi:type II secretory pathway pseudopilin PulG
MVTRRASGFTYMTALFIVAILGGGLALTGEVWHTSAVREKEAELLHIGAQYQRAIMLYYEGSPNRQPRYPRQLEDLVKDERYPSTRRYLRKIYPDPITGTTEWGIMKGPDGGIMGVFSKSTATPFKVRGPAATYSDWKFAYQPATAAVAKPSTTARPTPPPAR